MSGTKLKHRIWVGMGVKQPSARELAACSSGIGVFESNISHELHYTFAEVLLKICNIIVQLVRYVTFQDTNASINMLRLLWHWTASHPHPPTFGAYKPSPSHSVTAHDRQGLE